MINWEKTKEQFNIDKPIYRKKYCVVCDKCGKDGVRLLTRVADIINNQLLWECYKCCNIRRSSSLKKAFSSEEIRQKLSERSKKLWLDDEYRHNVMQNKTCDRDKMSNIMKELWKTDKFRSNVVASLNSKEVKHKLSKNSKKQWSDNEYKSKMIKLFGERSIQLWQNKEYREKVGLALKNKNNTVLKTSWKNPQYRQKMISLHKKLWQDSTYRQKMQKILKNRDYSGNSERTKKLWENKDYRNKLLAIMASQEWRLKQAQARALMPKVSSIQTTLYSILDDLGIKFYREYPDKPADQQCIIGPYNFDCVIPRKNMKTLLIECQGDYWHSIEKIIRRDATKLSYIQNNFSSTYELKYLWEHEFLSKDRITEAIKYWLGISQCNIIDFEFDDVEIKDCSAKEYRLLLSKYHYLISAGIGGIAYGAYINNILIAVCIFSPLGRQNKESSLGFKKDTIRELSRLCIHPSYQKKNFASWFISRCIKQLPMQYRAIVSYCDTTFNHNGATYKACNFTQSGEVKSDYWYVSVDGWIMHKKTLYNHAIKMHVTETEFADKMGYKKIYGDKKLRFTFVR